jgi:hypothetical protein
LAVSLVPFGMLSSWCLHFPLPFPAKDLMSILWQAHLANHIMYSKKPAGVVIIWKGCQLCCGP